MSAKKITVGIAAHVDAGKTTLSEALLFRSGAIRKLGRVDHRDAFLDTDVQERERGVTIFSKSAELTCANTAVTLLDTPGHADFSMDTERALQALDYAVLVISALDGVQSHTRTLWQLLAGAQIPVFVFINKMDQPGADRNAVMDSLREKLSENCVDLGSPGLKDDVALCDDALMERYLNGEDIRPEDIARLAARRQLFPCLFGSALKVEGVDELIDALDRFTIEPPRKENFAARVFRISRAPDGARLTWLKITGGCLKARAIIDGVDREGPWSEKVTQIRAYSGDKSTPMTEARPGSVCAVAGLTRTRPGDGLGDEPSAAPPVLEPALAYSVTPAEENQVRRLLEALRELEDEDPSLHVVWDERAQEIQLRLMGELQQSVVARQLSDRFAIDVSFGNRRVLYKETIRVPARGRGHFEPLRHYAEVHVLLEPLARGAGLEIAAACPDTLLDAAQQKTVLTCLREKTHLGTLTRSPITDMRITLTAGAYHEKHTEGGDFREAASRAVRNALRQAEGILLEPWYAFTLQTPSDLLGRAMTDIRRMHGSFEPAQIQNNLAVLQGVVPVSEVGDYHVQVASYTGGRGTFSCTLKGYEPCHNATEIISNANYNPDRDEEEPCGSVFCSHGAGFYVPWDQVANYMHVKE